jgi:hypothetical protein
LMRYGADEPDTRTASVLGRARHQTVRCDSVFGIGGSW